MQLPNRKPGKYTFPTFDPNLTPAKFAELKKHLEKLKTTSRPQTIKEVKRLAEMGDFSENAAYQIAKGRLRGINDKILELEDRLKKAIIIKPTKNNSTVQLGHQVTLRLNNQEKTYLILGSSETSPEKGIISYQSPLGAALLGQRVGGQIKIKNNQYKIIKIKTNL